jgi:hypothetical protein
MPEDISMEARSSCIEARTLSVLSALVQTHREPPSREISYLVTGCGGTIDEDLELIEMRYQQMLALMDLEELFANGHLDVL